MPQQINLISKINLIDFDDVLEETQEILRQCFKQFSLEEVFLSFNGGKDCTALLDITINFLKNMYNSNDVAKNLKIVYIRTNGPFNEIEEFVKQIESHYEVKLWDTDGEMKETLQRILDEDNSLKACLMGTRRTDPYCQDFMFLQKTDPNWPQIVRVSPLLNWSYHQIWSYILRKNVPYCSLYDIGYTSIGSTQNTLPNPYLQYKDASGHIKYRPAWHLVDGSFERAGRSKPTHPTSNGHATNVNCDISCSQNCV